MRKKNLLIVLLVVEPPTIDDMTGGTYGTKADNFDEDTYPALSNNMYKTFLPGG